jgi:hypothetical protein
MECIYIGEIKGGKFTHIASVCAEEKEFLQIKKFIGKSWDDESTLSGLVLIALLKNFKFKSSWYVLVRKKTQRVSQAEVVAKVDASGQYCLRLG